MYRALHVLDELDRVALRVLDGETVVAVTIFADFDGHRHPLLGKIGAQFARVLGFEADLDQLVVRFIGESLSYLDVLPIIHFEHGNVSSHSRAPVLEHFGITQYTSVHLADFLEVVRFDDEIGDADDRGPFYGESWPQRNR